MNEESKASVLPPDLPQKVKADPAELEYLSQIAGHLKSIRSMLTFFTIVLILVILVQIFT